MTPEPPIEMTPDTPRENHSEKMRSLTGRLPRGLVAASAITLILIATAIILAIIILPYPDGNGGSIVMRLLARL
jgi:hypothetical protein